jgi:hypothetical protein
MWKEFHFTAGGWRAAWIKFIVYGLVALVIFWAADRYYAYSFAQAAEVLAVAMLGAIVLESGFYVSRIFHDEWRERTLPLLIMLPVATSRMAGAKVFGCLPALVPALFWLTVACAILPNGAEEVVKAVFWPSRWFWALLYVLFLTLTAFFSLVVRWGALPLALAVMLTGATFGGCCFSPVVAILSQFGSQAEGHGLEGAFFCVDAVIILLILGLQFDIHRRLEIVAAH